MTVLHFLSSLESPQRELLESLHEFLLLQGEFEARIRYQIPFYYRHSWICYLNPLKNGGVELAFPRGNELSNEQGLLQANDRKQVRGIKLKPEEEIPWEALREIIQEALILDETVAYASKREKKK